MIDTFPVPGSLALLQYMNICLACSHKHLPKACFIHLDINPKIYLEIFLHSVYTMITGHQQGLGRLFLIYTFYFIFYDSAAVSDSKIQF